MNPDNHEASYEGTYLSVVIEGLAPLPRWDDLASSDDECLGSASFVKSAAKELTAFLAAHPSQMREDDDVVRLIHDDAQPWAKFVDPALSVVLPGASTAGVFLWECSDHVAVVAGWGSKWGDVAYGAHAHALIQTLRLKSVEDARVRGADTALRRHIEPSLAAVEQRTPMGSSHSPEQELGELVGLWRDAGYAPSEALPWARAGLLPLHAHRWAGWSVEDAIVFALGALRPARVTSWEAAHPGQTAVAWVRAGIRLDDASEWLDASVSLDEAMDYIAEGLTEPRYVSPSHNTP